MIYNSRNLYKGSIIEEDPHNREASTIVEIYIRVLSRLLLIGLTSIYNSRNLYKGSIAQGGGNLYASTIVEIYIRVLSLQVAIMLKQSTIVEIYIRVLSSLTSLALNYLQ